MTSSRPGAGRSSDEDSALVDPPPRYDYLEYCPEPVSDDQPLAAEVAVAISYNGINHAVMMATPNDVEDFVTGFTLTAGLVDNHHAIYDIDLTLLEDAIQVDVTLSGRAFATFKQRRRGQAGSGGCGLCGVEALDQALPPLPARDTAPLPPLAHLAGLRERFQATQALARDSGAMHAAVYVDGAGKTRLCREDIGRHNALDKLIGACARAGLDPASGFFAITSRCGLELIHKAVRAGAGTLVSLSAPSSLSVRQARRSRLNLIHQPHRGVPRLFSPSPSEQTGNKHLD
ncbi:formate dehydrogenase family accessory protein FdhD [Alcanivorax balearicus MACL04]|uniref:Sulfur carrier protein FdhD n=1 Tax=Alloalcanivorax balearicus MACL04 TaxID=1177182 RepID=A0ABT2R554_9GAMM|nr:formate dehydrogenase accessory sulfurtransferase FdhD [Alloalcanivorax balearicus]MCU5784827.1 formate dehydrogenase family accessory protein FdhD [Alloalcanivorax balearicus MACL04]